MRKSCPISRHPPSSTASTSGAWRSISTPARARSALRAGLPEREQHSDRGQGRGSPRPLDALDPDRPVLRGRSRRARNGASAGRLRPLREGSLRDRLPDERHGPRRGGPQHHGLQPVHRHPLLLEQLPLQSVRRFNYFNYNDRPLDKLWYGPLAEWGMAETLKMQKNPDVSVRTRDDGEMHLLRSADRAGQDRRQGDGQVVEPPARLPTGPWSRPAP